MNIIALWQNWLWTTKQSPARRFYVRAIARHQDAKLHLTGPGFPDWNDQQTGVQNIRRIMPDCQVVLGYKLAGTERAVVRGMQDVSREYLTCEAYNECWPGSHADFKGSMHPGGGTVVDECRKAGTRLVIIHHENDRDRVKPVEDYGASIVHIPHCADPDFFRPKPWSERRGVVLTGSLNREHYPLRQRWADLISSGKIPEGRIVRRPGNYTRSVEQSDALVRDYADAISGAKVKLGDSSRWGYPLAHFTETAMCGTAHVADMPECPPPGYERMVVAVKPDDPDDVLIEAVRSALDNAQELGTLALDASQQYTTAHYAQRFVEAASAML